MTHFVSSEAIFEVIGDYPVVDQFDILYSNLQSGSYTDNYVTGSVFTAQTLNGVTVYTVSSRPRGLAFSELGIDAATLPPLKSTYRNSYEYQPFRERAGITKNLKIFSINERYYDSLMPNVTKMISVLGGKIAYLSSNDVNVIQIGRPGGSGLTGHTHDFVESYPFEPKFSEINRLRNFTSNIVSEIEWGTGTQITPLLLQRTTVVETNGVSIYVYWQGDVESRAKPLNNVDLTKLIFGYGDRIVTKFDSIAGIQAVTGSKGVPEARYRGSSVDAISPIIRGWKYGIHDGNPHYFSCVFRKDRFGQLRDMLEQRKQSVSYIDYTYAPTAYFDPDEGSPTPPVQTSLSEIFNAKEGTIEYPVTVGFVKKSVTKNNNNVVVKLNYVEQPNRSLTWSSNLSTYATSSLPFFDLINSDVGRNRPAIDVNEVAQVEEFTL